jgi:hypothetical protein
MEYITSKTHIFIKVRKYPSDYIIEKFHKREPKALKKFNEIVRIYLDFYSKFVEYATGKSYQKHFQLEYFNSIECSKEEIHELTGIKIAESESHDIFCIPKNSETKRFCNWITDNAPEELKIKELKKTRGTYMDHGPSTYFRDNFKMPEETKKILKQHGE